MRRNLVGIVAVVGLGCIGDKAAALSVPPTLAVGAYGAVGFGDYCRGSKADLCSAESVNRIETITVDPPGTVEIVPVEQTPPDLLQVTKYPGPYVAHGLAAGTSKVCLQGLFSDGTHRRACVSVRVDVIAHVSADYDCGYSVGGVPAQPLVPAGTPLRFTISFHAADGTVLGGDILHPIDESGLTVGGTADYAWLSPPGGGTLTFGSPLDPSFSQTLATFTAGDVTAVAGETNLPPPILLTPGQGMDIQLSQDVAGRRTCLPAATRIQTETPSVCLGPERETVWTNSAGVNEAWFTAVGEGTCRLSLGVSDAQPNLGTLAVSYYLTNPADQGRDASPGDACPHEGNQACAVGRSAMLECRSRRWTVVTTCTGICDYTMPAANCVDGESCTDCR